MRRTSHNLSVTTQGPLYPPSEVMNADRDFVVIGRLNRAAPDGGITSPWGRAIVSPTSPLPPFGANDGYRFVRELADPLSRDDEEMELFTLPLPLPCNNYPMTFAPDQLPDARTITRPSFPLNCVPIPDLRAEDGPRLRPPITLGQWVRAQGRLTVQVNAAQTEAGFNFDFTGLIPDSLYTVMSLRQRDLDPAGPTRPGPLGVPNAFIVDTDGNAHYAVTMPNPFPVDGNRIINVVVLWMSYQQNYGGAIGMFGLGGDIHAQLKLQVPSFHEFTTHA
jgi:hypothetical protein